MPLPPMNSAPASGPPGSGASSRRVVPLVPGLDRRPAAARSLPEADAVRLFAVPESVPPYDDTVPAGQAAAADSTAAAGTASPGDSTAHGTAAAGEGTADAGEGTADAGEGTADAGEGTADAGEGTADGSSPADATGMGRRTRDQPGTWPSRFAQVLAETLAGSRSQGQIAPWTSDQARRRLRQLGPMLAAGTVPRVRRVVTTCPAAGVVEMTVIVGFGPRVRALAVRLERDGPPRPCRGRDAVQARWVCTAIEAA
jgi:Family of unknown function (DUF6459)